MSSLRLEIENLLGLRFPEKNGEAMIEFEETLEIPPSAERLMRGFYRNPESVKRGFQALYQETSAILEMLLPKRSKLREWSNDLPERPQDAEIFLRETADKLDVHEKRRQQIERELIKDLQENTIDDLFPLPVHSFGVVSAQNRSVKIFLKPLGRVAEMMGVNPEQMRQAVRIHFLIQLLLYIGSDLDGKTYNRSGDEQTLISLTTAYTMRYLQIQSKELAHNYQEWLKAWGGKPINMEIVNEQCLEKTRAAMIFWRRNPTLSWEKCWLWAEQMANSQAPASLYETDNAGFTVKSNKYFEL